ncbi:MAG: hypothetical protein ACLS8T_34290, partial [Anaerobutyricum sp.]
GMGTETTSATYRRTQNPLAAKFFYEITGIQKLTTNIWRKPISSSPFIFATENCALTFGRFLV